MRILLLSRYSRAGASTRVRTLQYLSYFKNKGINVTAEPLFSDEYLLALYSGKGRWKLATFGYLHRLKVFLGLRRYDLIWLEKEIFPFLPSVFEWLLNVMNIPYVVDYDDALFHRYDQHSWWPVRVFLGRKIDLVMRHAAVVIAGNEYLAKRALSAGARRVEIVPTVIDIKRYSISRGVSNNTPIVGWIGSPSTSGYLLELKSVFQDLREQFDVRFVAIGARQKDLAGLPVEVWPWSEETEVQSIRSFDIGIMPLSDSPWERGKCGYKLIQYMACKLPVVASPVGVNKEIVSHGENGFLAERVDDWKEALGKLLKNHDLRLRMGERGRIKVERWYSLQVQAPRLLSVFQSVES